MRGVLHDGMGYHGNEGMLFVGSLCQFWPDTNVVILGQTMAGWGENEGVFKMAGWASKMKEYWDTCTHTHIPSFSLIHTHSNWSGLVVE